MSWQDTLSGKAVLAYLSSIQPHFANSRRANQSSFRPRIGVRGKLQPESKKGETTSLLQLAFDTIPLLQRGTQGD